MFRKGGGSPLHQVFWTHANTVWRRAIKICLVTKPGEA